MTTNYQPWQQRVVDELVVLMDKLERLIAYTQSDAFNALDQRQQNLLLGQSGAMAAYVSILSCRVEDFKVAE